MLTLGKSGQRIYVCSLDHFYSYNFSVGLRLVSKSTFSHHLCNPHNSYVIPTYCAQYTDEDTKVSI